jgi:hypothetical protein
VSVGQYLRSLLAVIGLERQLEAGAYLSGSRKGQPLDESDRER